MTPIEARKRGCLILLRELLANQTRLRFVITQLENQIFSELTKFTKSIPTMHPSGRPHLSVHHGAERGDGGHRARGLLGHGQRQAGADRAGGLLRPRTPLLPPKDGRQPRRTSHFLQLRWGIDDFRWFYRLIYLIGKNLPLT